jgi:ATP-binding cassette, subfamily B, bacterial
VKLDGMMVVVGALAVGAAACLALVATGRALSSRLQSGFAGRTQPTVRHGGHMAGVLRDYRGPIAVAVLLALAESVLTLASPWPLKVVVDNAVSGAGMTGPLANVHPVTLGVLAAAAGVVLVATMSWLGFTREVLVASLSERMGVDLRGHAVDRLLTVPIAVVDRWQAGDLTARITGDVDRVRDGIVARADVLAPSILTATGMTVLMLVLDPVLALTTLAIVPGLVLLFRVRQQRVTAVQRGARRTSGQLTSHVNELVRTLRPVRVFGQEAGTADRIHAVSTAAARSSVAATSTTARLAPIADVLLAVGLAAVLVVGMLQVRAHHLTVGGLLVFVTYLGALQSPLRSLSRLSSTFGRASASRERLAEILDHGEVAGPARRRDASDGPPAVCIRDLGFHYEGGLPVLSGAELDVLPGETVCIVGPSGAGKSTLLGLLVRLYQPSSGSIFLDGIELTDLDEGDLRSTVTLVPQDPWLLDGSIADNIAFADPGAAPDAVRRAGAFALVDEFADRMPLGWDTPVGEGGAFLSGGQRRRLAIARAILADAPLLLLDEPTVGLDHEGAAMVAASIRRAAQGRTTIVVTHDERLARDADRVVRLEAGLLTEVPAPSTVRAAAVPAGAVVTTLADLRRSLEMEGGEPSVPASSCLVRS